MSTIKQQKTVLEFWNAVEFFNFFDLDDALKTIDPECIFKNEDAFPWQHDKLSQDYRFTIFLGISNAGEISAALDEKPDEFTMAEKDTKKRTCVGKIVLEDEGGFARLDYVGLSTLNWAMAKHLQGQIPLSSNFSTYQQSLETYTNSSIVPAFSKIQLKDLPPAYIKRVYEMFVSSTHQQSASCDLWQAPELRFITVRQPKNKKSHFSKYLASYFEKDDMGFADADQSFRRYLMARANDDDRSMGEQQEELLKIFRSFDLKSTCTTTTLDPDFIDDMIDSIFAVKEIEILNSFFLDDLEFGLSTLTQTKGPSLLRSYLTTNSEYTDLFKGVSSATVFESLRPARSPLVRWPTKPSQPLSLMQQFAVNKALDLQKFELLSVNGPPGTGKTTLLRDIIANIILTKANHLSSITHASDAFDSSNQLTVNGFRFSPLKKYLTGHEILVASSNNGAVENISKELPLLKNIDPEFQGSLSFLSNCANLMRDPDVKDSDTWGLCSVPLGRRSNIDLLTSALIFGKKKGVGISNLAGWISDKSKPKLTFQDAKKLFCDAKKAVEKEQAILDQAFTISTKWINSKHLIDATQRDIETKKKQSLAIQEQQLAFEQRKSELSLIRNNQRPSNWFEKIFFRSEARRKEAFLREIDEEALRLFRQSQELSERLSTLRTQLQDCEVELDFMKNARVAFEKLSSSLQEEAELLERDWDDRDLQMRTPFQTEKFNRLRSLLFVSAIALHEAWLEDVKTGSSIRSFVYNLPEVFSNPKLRSSPAGHALLQIFFYFFPVVSTTFAAVRGFLRYVPRDHLGWLFVDEAGQSLPQSAVGALLRCQRALIVGDPLQLEPIHSLPDEIAAKVCAHFKSKEPETMLYNPFEHSVQSISDRCHSWGALLHNGQRIGIPLRVHRRCDNPMFDLANRIAYDGKMILGKKSEIVGHPEVGESCWFHIAGSSQGTRGHWVKEQGEFVLRLIRDLNRGSEASIFVISPFREVIYEFKTLARSVLSREACSFNKDWINTAVGTINTFQGKEADIVIILLGLDERTRYSAKRMIGGKPNLLNVGATRAKRHLYIVGNCEVWCGVFSFDAAYEMLPRREGLSLVE